MQSHKTVLGLWKVAVLSISKLGASIRLLILLAGVMPLSLSAHPGFGLDIDSKGNIIFSDIRSLTIWKLSPEGDLQAVSSGKWTHGFCLDEQDRIWIESEVNNTSFSVYRIDPEGNEVKILGPTEGGLSFYGSALLVDSEGALFFPYADPPGYYGLGIQKRSPDGTVELLAGGSHRGSQDGRGSMASFDWVQSMCWGPEGDIYLVDFDSIRKVNWNGEVETLFQNIRLKDPENQPFDNGNPRVSNRLFGLDVTECGDILVAYHGNRSVLKLSSQGREVIYQSTKPWSPVGVAVHPKGIVIKEASDGSAGPRIRLMKSDGSIQTLIEVE